MLIFKIFFTSRNPPRVYFLAFV